MLYNVIKMVNGKVVHMWFNLTKEEVVKKVYTKDNAKPEVTMRIDEAK